MISFCTAFSSVAENTAFFGDILLHMPDMTHAILEHYKEWGVAIKWGIGFCNESNIYMGSDKRLLSLVSVDSTDIMTIVYGLYVDSTDIMTIVYGLYVDSTDIMTIVYGLYVDSTDITTIVYVLYVGSTDITTIVYGLSVGSTDITTIVYGLCVASTDITTIVYGLYRMMIM